MKTPSIAIVDYGVGNIYSLCRAFHSLGVLPVVTEDEGVIRRADAVVLPGVGSFEAGMRGLAIRGLASVVQDVADSGTPMLGICLGAQLFFSKGYEFGEHVGLGIIPGVVVRFPELPEQEKIPQVGWNRVMPASGRSWDDTLFSGLEDSVTAYFVHSYIFVPESEEHSFGMTRYGGYDFCSVVRKGAIYGCQFHPEKSASDGLHILQNFVTMLRQ